MTGSFRPVSENDLTECVRLYCSVFNEEPWNDAWTEQTAQTRLHEILEAPGYRGYAATRNSDVIGFAMGNLEQWHSGKRFFLKEMLVDTALQQSGIGTDLLDYLITELRRENVEQVYLLTMRDSPAYDFYKKNGFTLTEQTTMLTQKL
ncbi:GNAT family N-acetyltransferase [halophilic archaeon]|nr:GNAT family N-acetyltransferase [halophilic archaeon]